MVRRIIAGLALLSIAACVTPSQPGTSGGGTSSTRVKTGSDFTLKPGQEARVDGTPLRIRFDRVSEDSRCPVGVECVWAGNAVARLSVTSESATSDVALNTTLEPKTVVVYGYRLTLVSVNPPARQGGVPAVEYVVVLQVTGGA